MAYTTRLYLDTIPVIFLFLSVNPVKLISDCAASVTALLQLRFSCSAIFWCLAIFARQLFLVLGVYGGIAECYGLCAMSAMTVSYDLSRFSCL